MTSFNDLGLGAPLCAAVAAEGYSLPTPIQASAIPHVLAGRDLMGIAQTGTGKTAAFALPILDRLARCDEGKQRPRAPKKGVRALILSPTRELSVQIDESFATYGRGLGLSRTVVLGGVGLAPQIKALSKGLDILVATPGRLLDLMNSGHVRLDMVEVFVLDEADRMLDMGFIRDVKRIVAKLPMRRQTLLFSATMPESVCDLAASILHNPERVEVTPPASTVERIEQKVLFVARENKRRLLENILRSDGVSRAIVFMRTKHGANKVAEQLEKNGLRVDAIHGNKSQSARQKALSAFRAGNLHALIATDIAARGIDVDGVSHVINFDMPEEPENYVHRIGRTARAGAGGIALSFCVPDEAAHLRAIEKTIGRKVPVDAEHPYHAGPSFDARERTERPARSGRGPASRYSGKKKPQGTAQATSHQPSRGPGNPTVNSNKPAGTANTGAANKGRGKPASSKSFRQGGGQGGMKRPARREG